MAVAYLATSTSTSGVSLEWLTTNPQTPEDDYHSFDGLPSKADIGAVSLSLITAPAPSVWALVDDGERTYVTPLEGESLTAPQWARVVDTREALKVSWGGSNLSRQWVRLSDERIAPRSA